MFPLSPSRDRRGRYDVEALLDAGGGIARIPDFLPKKVATRILKTLLTVSDEEWGMTAAQEDPSANSIAHAFLSAKRFPNRRARARAARRPTRLPRPCPPLSLPPAPA